MDHHGVDEAEAVQETVLIVDHRGFTLLPRILIRTTVVEGVVQGRLATVGHLQIEEEETMDRGVYQVQCLGVNRLLMFINLKAAVPRKVLSETTGIKLPHLEKDFMLKKYLKRYLLTNTTVD